MARLYRGTPDGPCRRGLRRRPPELMRPFSSVGPTTAPTGNEDTGHTGHHSQRLRRLLRDREIMLLKDTKTCPGGKEEETQREQPEESHAAEERREGREGDGEEESEDKRWPKPGKEERGAAI